MTGYVEFSNVIALIDGCYTFTETEFTNGEVVNRAGQNNGSCKVFAFGKLHGLDEKTTLALFGEYYRIDVLKNPNGEDHANIRNFMGRGWEGIRFAAAPEAVLSRALN